MCSKTAGWMNSSILSSQNSISAKSTLKFNASQDSIDNSTKVIEEGQQFASAIASLARGNYIPAKKHYPSFKTTFWEEPKYNPALSQTSQEYECTSHLQEASSHWGTHGHHFDLEKRFIPPKPANERGPRKREEYPHFFESGQKYYGRKREILPLLRAKIYTRPLDRCDEEIQKRNRRPNTLGPGSYDLGDPWQPKSYSAVGPINKPSSFMESKTKRNINEYFGISEGSSSPNREVIHHAKTRSLLPNTPQSLINMPQNHTNTLGVNTVPEIHGNEVKVQRSPSTPQKLQFQQHSTSLYTHSSRPHTAGPLFSKSSNEPNFSGVPPNVHFIRIMQQSGPLIVPIPNETLANESLEGLSDDNMTSVVDTWSRPQTRGERDNLVVEAIPLQFESPFKSIPDELKRTSSPPSPHHNRPTSSKVSPSKPKVSPGQATSSASPPTIPATTNEPPPRSPNKKIPPEKFFDSPKLSKRSLSYEYLQKEKKIQSKLSAIQSNQITSPSNTQKVTSLFLSEKVAVNVPDTRGTSRKGIVYDDELYSNLTNRSQDILNSMME